MAAKRAPGGLDADDYTSSNDSSNNRKRGGNGNSRRGIADATMLSRAVADAVGTGGAGASLSERLGGAAVPVKGRGALSVKGASGTTVEVRGLVKGTTAEDVKVRPRPISLLLTEEWRTQDSGHPYLNRQYSVIRGQSSLQMKLQAVIETRSQCT